MDLSTLASVEETTIDLLSPKTGEPTGATVTVASYDSERVKKGQRERANKRLKTARNAHVEVTAEELEADGYFNASLAVVSWTEVEENGQPVECTRENVERLLRTYPWLFDQVHIAARNRSLFIKG